MKNIDEIEDIGCQLEGKNAIGISEPSPPIWYTENQDKNLFEIIIKQLTRNTYFLWVITHVFCKPRFISSMRDVLTFVWIKVLSSNKIWIETNYE